MASQKKSSKSRARAKQGSKSPRRATPRRRTTEPVAETATLGVLDGASGALVREALMRRLRG